MRPERLVIQAYTAYPTKQIIDFSKLGHQRLMMISGETGAGKTAILDAMTYALFGQSSGGLRPERSVRSDHAKTGVKTFVDLRFKARLVRRVCSNRAVFTRVYWSIPFGIMCVLMLWISRRPPCLGHGLAPAHFNGSKWW